MKTKKLLSLLVTMFLMLNLVTFAASAALDFSQTTIMISTVDELKELAAEVNGGNTLSGKTVELVADLDLNNEEWTPIGTQTNQFKGTFDGNDFTISNLKITGNNSNVGLFGFTSNGALKNFTLENAEVAGYLNVGAVAGTPYTSTYDNIQLIGTVKIDGYAYVGGMFGKNVYANLSNLTIDVDEESYVKAESENYRTYVGGVVGFMGEGGHSVTNVVSNIDVYGSTCDVGGITGIIHYGNQFISCISSGDVTVTAYLDDGDQLEAGGIAGVWHNQNGTSVKIQDCFFTGTLSAIKADGTVYDGEFENSGLVGKAYSSTGTGEMVQIFNPVRIGNTYYPTLQQALDAAEDGDTIQLMETTISEGTITMPTTLSNLTIVGSADFASVLKDSTLQTADGNTLSYNGLTISGILFDNSNVVMTGWRTGDVSFHDIIFKNNKFQNVVRTDGNQAAIHINTAAHEVITNLTIEGNVIDGVSGSSNSGIYAQADGEIIVKDNVINNVAFRPYIISVNNANETADSLSVTGNTFSGSSKGRAQALGSDAEGTDAVILNINNNIFQDITEAQQICYWNFNPETTAADFSHNYYDVDVAESYNQFYYNAAATSPADLLTYTIYPYYTALTEDGVIDEASLINGAEYAMISIDETYYASADLAVAAAADGDTVVLLADVSLNAEALTLAQEKALSFELFQYTLSVDSTEDASALITVPDHYKLSMDAITDGEGNTTGYDYALIKLFTQTSGRGGSSISVVDKTPSADDKTEEEPKTEEPKEEDKVDNGTADADKIVLTIGSATATVFGETITNDVAPQIVNDRTMLPARFVAESLGATVTWVPEGSGKVLISMEGIEIVITIGSETAMVNGEEVALDCAAFIENDRTYLPIRFISENLGATVLWNENNQTVTIIK